MNVTLHHGDITRQHADVIVNAANSTLLGGGGVDGAIHRAGGPAILAECRDLRNRQFQAGLPTGEAAVTTAGDLHARWVIHTVGPVYSSTEDRSGQLLSCYTSALRVCDELSARSIAFPAISTGVYRWPMDEAARLATAAVRFTPAGVADRRFVLFDEGALGAFGKALRGTGPDDATIAGNLASHSAGLWQRLFEVAGDLTSEDPGRADEIFTLVGALVDNLVFDWTSWIRVAPQFPSGQGLDAAPVADAARLAVAYMRGARFNERALEQCVRSGALRAIVTRFRRWFEEELGATPV